MPMGMPGGQMGGSTMGGQNPSTGGLNKMGGGQQMGGGMGMGGGMSGGMGGGQGMMSMQQGGQMGSGMGMGQPMQGGNMGMPHMSQLEPYVRKFVDVYVPKAEVYQGDVNQVIPPFMESLQEFFDNLSAGQPDPEDVAAFTADTQDLKAQIDQWNSVAPKGKKKTLLGQISNTCKNLLRDLGTLGQVAQIETQTQTARSAAEVTMAQQRATQAQANIAQMRQMQGPSMMPGANGIASMNGMNGMNGMSNGTNGMNGMMPNQGMMGGMQMPKTADEAARMYEQMNPGQKYTPAMRDQFDIMQQNGGMGMMQPGQPMNGPMTSGGQPQGQPTGTGAGTQGRVGQPTGAPQNGQPMNGQMGQPGQPMNGQMQSGMQGGMNGGMQAGMGGQQPRPQGQPSQPGQGGQPGQQFGGQPQGGQQPQQGQFQPQGQPNGGPQGGQQPQGGNPPPPQGGQQGGGNPPPPPQGASVNDTMGAGFWGGFFRFLGF